MKTVEKTEPDPKLEFSSLVRSRPIYQDQIVEPRKIENSGSGFFGVLHTYFDSFDSLAASDGAIFLL